MIEIKLYESPDIANRTAALRLALPVVGLTTWNGQVGTAMTILGLRFKIDKLFPSVYRDEHGAFIYARLQSAGDVGSLTGWLICATQLPGSRWAAYLARPLDGAQHHVATSNTQATALEEASTVAIALSIDTAA